MPQVVEPDVSIGTISANVGGICFCCSTNSTSKVSLDKKHYTFGETATATINCNNSACAKDIKSFSLLLYRRLWAQDIHNTANPVIDETLLNDI